MQLFDNLAAVGLTTSVLQIVIISAIVIFIVGMYWRYIVVGVGVVFCVAVFAMPSKKDDKPIEVAVVTPPPSNNKEEPKWEEIKPQPPVVEVKPEPKVKSDQELFMEDCKVYGGLTQSQCNALWRDRESDMEPVKWRKKWQKDYMIKVQNARI
jgi:cell division protein FtsW (lipid II flippase)